MTNLNSPQGETLRAETIEDWLVNRLAEVLRVSPDEIDIEEPFANYGLGSYQGVELAGDLSTKLGRDLPETLVWDYPTIKEMARHLSELPPAGSFRK
ncbi:MAG TPA: acyl carrier protein [Pyrinomonadaceae bacterium]|jgi:acyl carrier protein